MFRVLGFRHNPYIGNFHRINYIPFNSENFFQNIMNESKTNPMIGLLRHSPSVISRSRNSHGKKSSQLAKKQQQQQPPPVLSRLALLRNRPKESSQQHSQQQQPDNPSEPSFVSSLREFHRNVYSVSSLSSHEGNSPLSPLVDHPVSDNDIPMCAICMEKYCNGDEILTLKCSHCFHSECISKWFYQDCLNSEDMRSNFTCPHCRKTNNNNNNNNEESKENQELGSIDSETLLSLKKLQISASDGVSIVSEEGILTESLFKLGKSLLEEDGGYDFVSVNSLNSQLSSAEPKQKVSNQLPPQQQQQQEQQPVIAQPPPEPEPQPQESKPQTQQQPYIEPPSPGAFSVSNYSDCGIPLNSFSE
jgi:hypothetical protein